MAHDTHRKLLGSDDDRIARAVLKSATDFAILTTDQNRNINSWNVGAETLLGWSEQEMLGTPIARIFTPEDRAAGVPEYEEERTSRLGRAEDERWHMRKDGSRFWASGLMMRFEDENTGEQIGFLKILRDRTAQYLAESEAGARETQFRALVEASPQMTFFADMSGHITYRNPFWYQYTGSAPGRAGNDDWAAAVHPADRKEMLAVWRHALASGQSCQLEVRFLRASDRSWRWFMAKAEPMRSGDGELNGWIIIGVDIDLMVAARNDLSRNKRELETEVAVRTADRDRMWRLSSDVMLVTDFNARILSVNPAWTAQLGWSEAELLGNYFVQFIHPDDVIAAQSEIARLQSGRATSRFQCRYQHKGGGYRTLAWTAVPGDGMIHAVGRDLTAETVVAAELEQAQEALRQSQKMEAVGQLTGGIAHDFNNLLTGILGSLEMMQRRAQRGQEVDVARYTNAAMESAKRAAALTHRLLAFSRRQPLDPKQTDANNLLHGLAELFRQTLGESIELTISTGPGLWPTLCDSHQLENALLNLVINARDAMPNGGSLTVETINTFIDRTYTARAGMIKPGAYICIAVSDTGAGMSPEVMAQAFEPFFTTKPLGEGTGLGLSMIYGFARQSNGHARIYSELGKGTTVKLYLPRFEGADNQQEIADTAAIDQAESQHGKTVLIVEDEHVVRNLLVEVLNDLHFHVLEAGDGPSGLAILEADNQIDLVVTDIGLPGLNGRQMVDAARKVRPDLRVLFMTGYAENAAIAGGFLEPGMEMITKPFAVNAMVKRVLAMLGSTRNRL